jgi:hypothetical protein
MATILCPLLLLLLFPSFLLASVVISRRARPSNSRKGETTKNQSINQSILVAKGEIPSRRRVEMAIEEIKSGLSLWRTRECVCVCV